MSQTPVLDLPLLQTAQAQKEITHNEALLLLDILVGGRVLSAYHNAPPADAEEGQAWIVGPSASGTWTGKDNQLALMVPGGWRFVTPPAGFTIWVVDQFQAARFDGFGWNYGGLQGQSVTLAGQKIIGHQQPAIAGPTGGTVIDMQARAALEALLQACRTHGLIAN